MKNTRINMEKQCPRASGARCVVTAFIGGCLVLALNGGCNGDGPVDPEEVREVLYYGAEHSSAFPHEFRIYVYEADNLTLVDSLPISWFPSRIVAAPDGRHLYVYRRRADGPPLVKLDSRTGDEIWSSAIGPWPARPGSIVTLLDSGRLLVAGLTVWDKELGTPLYTLPDSLSPGYGPETGTEVAAVVDNAGTTLDSVVTVLDCATGATRGRFVPYAEGYRLNSVYYARLHPDGVRVLVIGVRFVDKDSWFVIGNVETGETLFYHRLIYSFGEVAISPDGSLAAVTDPSQALIYDSFPTLDLFNLGTYLHLKRFDDLWYSDSLFSWVGQVRFQAGGDHLLVAPATPLGPGALRRIDLQTLTVVNSALQPGCEPAGINCPFAGGVALGLRASSNDGSH